MMKLIELLKKNPDVTYYQVTKIKKEACELYFVHKNLETVRNVDTLSYKVTVYNLHNNLLGSSNFTVFSSDDEKEIVKKIDDAVTSSKLINNKPYLLPEKEIDNVTIESDFSKYSLMEIAEKVSDACFKADSYEDGSINALEIFINKIEEEIVNSNGLDKVSHYYTALIEAIPTWNNKNESVELYEAFRFNTLDLEKISEEINSKMIEVKNRMSAQKPKEKLNLKVALRAQELSQLFGELASQVSAASIYSHANAFNVHDKLQNSSNTDPLTITLRGSIEGNCNSRKFDGSGLNLIDTLVISNGEYVNTYGDNRFSQYLGFKPTGNLNLLDVEKGSFDEKGAEYFECVSLSGLQLDIYNDYIGGEIRLGYIHKDSKIIPVTGISFSGKVSEILNNMKLSKEIVQEGYYRGPKLALFDKIEIN